MVKIKGKPPGLNLMVGGTVVKQQPLPKPALKKAVQPALTGPGPKSKAASAPPAKTIDVLEKTSPGNPKSVTASPGGESGTPVIQEPSVKDPQKVSTTIQADPLSEPPAEFLTPFDSQGHPPIAPAHRSRYRQLSARNRQIGSKDAELQSKLINEKAGEQYGDNWFVAPVPAPGPVTLNTGLNNHFSDPDNLDSLLLRELQQAPINNDISRSLSGRIVDPNNLFVQPHEGASARTRIMGNFVIKGYDSQEQTEVEWVGTRLMQATGEHTPDIRMASLELRNNIMAVDPEFKQLDTFKTTLNPRMLEPGQPMAITETFPVKDPLHCLVMPRVFGSNMMNIVEEPSLRESLKSNIGTHVRELARIAFKDILLGNSDRVFRMYPGEKTPPYMPTQEEIKKYGSPMNLGNIMFQTIDGEILPHSAIAIDNYGHSTNKLNTQEGKEKELAAFKYYIEDVQRTFSLSPGEVLSEDHVVSLILRSLKSGIDSDPNFPGETLVTLSDEEMLAIINEGVKLGWSQVTDTIDSLQEFLKSPITEGADPTENTLAYMDTVSKKLDILKNIKKPH